MNGQPWTRREIDELCDTVERGGDIVGLSRKLNRTHEAVIAKARRLNLQVAIDLPAQRDRVLLAYS